MMATAALVVIGIVLVMLGLFAAGGSIPIIALGIVSQIAAAYFQTIGSRRA
jgi:hypothetical protein